MPRALLSALAIYAIGCVVPAPLEAETGEVQHPPVITCGEIDGQETCLFGPRTESFNMEWSFGVTARDENADDQLTARAFVRDGDQYYKLASSDVTLTASPTDPLTRSGTFPAFTYCFFQPFQSGTPKDVYVVVTDGKFSRSDSTPTEPGFTDGRWDEKYWVVTCQ